ncbi:MAG: hypothetical protein ABSG68_02010 [Thermoguttaceae bacterium]|jgi:hypothetical protein
MIRITIDTDRPEYAGAAKWFEVARVLRDLADKCEQPMREKCRVPMILKKQGGDAKRVLLFGVDLTAVDND